MSRQTLGVTTLAASRTQFNITERNVQAALNACDTLLEPLRLELSIIPKPVTLYRKMITSLQRTHDLLVSLRYVRERIRKETVVEIKDQRLNFVSESQVYPVKLIISQINALILVFYASMHAFRSSTPLPQFLPSLYTALNDMLSAIDDKLIEILSSDEMILRRQLSSYRLHYALSEAEILLGLVTSMEEMLSIAKSLFGQTSIFDESPNDEKGETENLDSLPLHTLGHTGWSSGPTSPTMQILTSPAKKLSLKHRENGVEKQVKEYPGDAYILNYSPPGASVSPPPSKDTSIMSLSELANKESKDTKDSKDNKEYAKLPPRTHSKRRNRNIEGIPLARDLFQQASSSTSSSPVDQQNYLSRPSSLTSARTSPVESTNQYRTRTRRKDSGSSYSSNTRIR